MQRRNYAALFAALVIGFGAIEAQAAEVRSVTVTAPDSGATLGIGGEFTVRVVVRDFTPDPDDGVIIALVKGDSLVGDDDDAANGGIDHPLNTDTLADGTTPNTETTAPTTWVMMDTDPAAASFAAAFGRSDAPPITGGATGIVAIRIRKGNDDGSGAHLWAGDGKSIDIDAGVEEVIYTWTGTIHVSSGMESGVRAAAVSVDDNDPADNTKDDAAVTAGDGSRSPTSPGSVLFAIDAERPFPPATVVGTVQGLSTVLLNRNTTDESDDIRLNVAGVGDVLNFDVTIAPANMPLLLEQGHTVVLAITTPGVPDKETVYNVPLVGRTLNTLHLKKTIANGDFPDNFGVGTPGDAIGSFVERNTATAYIVDRVGNRSKSGTAATDPDWDTSANSDNIGGATDALTYIVDGTAPAIDGVPNDANKTASDTLEIASPDTVSDGTMNADLDGVDADQKAIRYKLFEDLGALTFDIGGTKLTVMGDSTSLPVLRENAAGDDWEQATEDADNDPNTAETEVAPRNVATDSSLALSAAELTRLVFAAKKNADGKNPVTSLQTVNVNSGAVLDHGDPDGEIPTGVKTIKVQATDLAGNKGPEAVRADVYVDVDTLTFNGLFPRKDDVPTIEETSTADVRFSLSEHADSVLISYVYVSGKDALRAGEAKTRALTGGELVDLGEQVFEHEEFINAARRDTGLVHDTDYRLTLLGADLAGNYSLTDAGVMKYDTSYVVPPITFFTMSSNPPGGTRTDGKCGLADCGPVPANKDPKIELTVNAWNKKDVAALAYGKVNNYNNDAVVTVSGGSGEGLALSGKGVVTEGMAVGTARLTSDAWGVGRIGSVISWQAKVSMKASEAPETHSVKVEDLTSDPDTSFVGRLDSVLVIKHAPYKEIEISVSDTLHLHSLVDVGLRYVDEFGNTVLDVDNYVEVSTSVIGVELPPGALQVKDGVATFSIRSNAHLGSLPLTVRNVTKDLETVATKTVTVTERPAVVGPPTDDGTDDGDTPDPRPDAPDKLVGEDYKGALGQGDQGGFVMLTWDLSDNHSTLDGGYRIWRDVTVTQGADENGNVVELAEPTIRPVAWGHVDAIPGVDVMQVVVATLDGDATFYGVTAESQGLASDATRTGGADDGMADDGTADDGTADDGMADDGAEDDGMEDDGAEDDGMEDDGGEGTGTDTTATDTTANKRAFTVTQSVSMPYELMAETMVRSREAAQGNLEGPVFATLTPEALAFHERGGLVPSLKSVQGELVDHITRTEEAVRAIDDIAPAPVTWVRALDTPGDAGASITIDWTRSIDDRVMTSVVPQAVGANGNVFTSAGVVGYNISRRIGDGAWQLLGVAPAGSSSWEDLTAANGVRYSYKVEPKDLEQITASEIVKSAMAIRNTVVDGDGNRIVGLFGADNRVDYDDFFIFADHFGLTAESDLYEAAFDIIPNDVIDVDDFFAFAESFGKEVAGIGKAVPTKAGLNSEARFYIDNAAGELPRVGEEMSLLVSLEDFAEVRGYGFTVNFDDRYLEFVEPRFENNPLGEAGLAQPRVIANADGEIHIAAFGETVSEGDLGVTLVFRSIEEIEESLVEVMAGGVQDGSYGLNRITDPVAIRVETRPEVYALENNFPNPFNPETTIKYQLPDANEVTLEVFNMLGQVVRTMVDREFQNAGRYSYQWDATNDSGQPLSSGIYFYRVTAGGEFQSHKKMLLLK